MAQKQSNDNSGMGRPSHRQFLIAQIKAYLAICVRKHDFDVTSLPSDWETEYLEVELLSLMHMLRDLAHLPPE